LLDPNRLGEVCPDESDDPVAVTYAIRSDLCPATPMRLEVDDKGFTRPVEGVPNAQVSLHSDEKGFLEFLMTRIAGEAGQ